MNTSETTGNGAGNTAGTAAGHVIAIIGLEGSGKTVFLAALAQAMQDNDGHPYLEATPARSSEQQGLAGFREGKHGAGFARNPVYLDALWFYP